MFAKLLALAALAPGKLAALEKIVAAGEKDLEALGDFLPALLAALQKEDLPGALAALHAFELAVKPPAAPVAAPVAAA